MTTRKEDKTPRRQRSTKRSPRPRVEDLDAEIYINREQLRGLIPACDMTLYRWTRDSKVAFPPPVQLGRGSRNYWWLPAVREWMRQREARDQVRRSSVRSDGAAEAAV